MKRKSYTFFIASADRVTVHRLRVPHYLAYLLALLIVVGGATVLAALGSYSRMLWKVANYNALRRDQQHLLERYRQLQTVVKTTNQQLNSLQSLAGEVAATYGITRFKETPFAVTEAGVGEPTSAYEQSLNQFDFLKRNASAVALSSEGLRLLPGPRLGDAAFMPNVWPVMGLLTGGFGQRMDPFNDEGAFHSGVDIASHYGDAVRATADGVVEVAEDRGGYGRLVIIEHGFGISTWYGHLAAFHTHVGMQVTRGEVIGYEGQSGRATAPHLHYEVRLYNTPVNPWRYLHARAYSGD